MSVLEEINLFKLYLPLATWVGLGIFLGRQLPPSIPYYLGKFLYWVGVPISIMAFLRQADLSGSVWVAPMMAWIAVFMGLGLSWLWIYGTAWFNQRLQKTVDPSESSSSVPKLSNKTTQGSFLLSTMVGNTGYLGYPISLALIGPQYFAWTLFYDTLGSTLAAYGLGVAIAARCGSNRQDGWQVVWTVLSNPGLASFVAGLAFRQVSLPTPVEEVLRGAAWSSLALALLLIGMRLSQLTSWRSVRLASVSLIFKMLLVPVLIGIGLTVSGFIGAPRLAIVLQVAMPPAFATLVLSEAYDLDRELTVTALAIGSVVLLFTLPLWIILFPL